MIGPRAVAIAVTAVWSALPGCRDHPAPPVDVRPEPALPSASAVQTKRPVRCSTTGADGVICLGGFDTVLTGKLTMRMEMLEGGNGTVAPLTPHAVYFLELSAPIKVYPLLVELSRERGPKLDGGIEVSTVQVDAEFQGPYKTGDLYPKIGKTVSVKGGLMKGFLEHHFTKVLFMSPCEVTLQP